MKAQYPLNPEIVPALRGIALVQTSRAPSAAFIGMRISVSRRPA